MGGHINSNRRRWQRLPLAIPLFVRGADNTGKHFVDFTIAVNISAGGALVLSRHPLSRTTKLSLEIPTAPLSKAPIAEQSIRSLKARVVRAGKEEAYNVYALRFSRPLISFASTTH